MDKFWLKSYPKEVPAEVQVDQYQSLVALLEDSFRRFAARKAYACMGKSITYREVDQLSQRIAGWLQNKGLAKGARVAIMMPTPAEDAMAGAASAGGARPLCQSAPQP